ncbi:ATP-binding response regulator [Cerasicoccus arenae]|uniref:histidine kinase n=1 Tax=Cerasicoccus arenae TaxID=424488 RepID=A0A8J3DCT1_9BACT|nr:hybrid sensor histidine kinase/response regulator [Cerasicoccus arenae]MBK1858801.1 hybrid sensor histidine kinase/response regulator [Cerasicoccus arenae]GHC04514.1 hybrid sensor histidine kinase/response regulator [Cerasicoccus arenae]
MELIDKSKSESQPLVLAVDDQPENLRLLGNTLSGESLSMAFSISGEEALEWLNAHTPDLILLDIMMPGMDGLACCRQLKTRKQLADVPVIFLTARVESDDIEAGFQAGAVDYVTKPFRPTELIARVHTHLKLQAQRKDLEHHLMQKSELVGIIAHDIRGPIASIRALIDVLLEDYPEQHSGDFPESNFKLLRAMAASADKTLYTLSELLNAKISHTGHFEPEFSEFPLSAVFETVGIRNTGQSLKKHITLNFDPGNSPIVHADRSLLTEVVDNLVSNAVKYSPKDKTVTIQALSDSTGRPQLLVSDEGPGFKPEDYARLYRRFERLSAHPTAGEASFGLGLALVKELMVAQGGDVELISPPNESAVFRVTFSN